VTRFELPAAPPDRPSSPPACTCAGPGGGRDEQGRPERRRDGEDYGASSRADSTDDWGTVKKFEPTSGGQRGGFGDGPRRGGGGFEDRPFSNSDAVDDWGSSKKFEPSQGRDAPGGFRDRDGPARRPPIEPSKADEEDQWSRGKQFQPSEGDRGGAAGGRGDRGSRGFGFSGGDPDGGDRWERRAPPPEEASSKGVRDEPPAERPRLKLNPRTKPLESATSAEAAAGEVAAAERPKGNNPFGNARPREEVLKEKGVVEPSKPAEPPVKR
jgi:hypothetical protein